MAPRKGVRGNSMAQGKGDNKHVSESLDPIVEAGPDVDMADTSSSSGAESVSYWLTKWKTLDLKSTIASQVEFLKARPNFDKSRPSYIFLFNAIRNTILRVKADPDAIKEDVIARANVKLLLLHFENLADQSRRLLKDELDHIRTAHYSQYATSADFENVLNGYDNFLLLAGPMARTLDLEEEWIATSNFLGHAKLELSHPRQQDLSENTVPSGQDLQPAKSFIDASGPPFHEIPKMDSKFTEAGWFGWLDSCIFYFLHWTAKSDREVPAEEFVQHLSNYRLAMEQMLRHKTIRDNRHSKVIDGRLSTLFILAKKYMGQYSDYASRQLEKQYAELRVNWKKGGIYETEAAFWRLANAIEVFVNEAPHDIEVETWAEAVPTMLPKEKVLVAKKTLNLLYKGFQIKRYPEDEVAYLWLLTWRNIKHMLSYWISPDLWAIWPEDLQPGMVIQPRDLALPFVEKNLSRLLDIVRKDNDALYQKEIEELVGDYCAHIDKCVKGKAEGADAFSSEYNTIRNNKKRVPFAHLVHLEESLFKNVVPPTDMSQMISHRVIVRMNHIMEGPKVFKKWELTKTGAIKTYRPTSTWLKEQRALTQQAGFIYGDPNLGKASSEAPDGGSEAPAAGAGAGAGGDDNGDGDGKRNPHFGDDEEPSESEEEIEVISPGGTKRVLRRKKGKRVADIADTLIKNEELFELRGSSSSEYMGSRLESGSRSNSRRAGREESPDEEILSGIHPVPPDSNIHHRRRLDAHRVVERSAVPNAQYPLPETAAPQRAVALQIGRELADPGIFTEGPRPEDVQNYINPALRLPSEELDLRTTQTGQGSQSSSIRRTLNRFHSYLGTGFFRSPPRRAPPRATPSVPESNAQRARRKREAQDVTPPVLRRQPDRFSVTKSPQAGKRKSRRSHGKVSRSEDIASDPSLPWSDKENQEPFKSTSGDVSNQENESPEKDSNQENQEPTRPTQQAQANPHDWNSPSPPHEHDNRIYEGSPMRTPSTPTPVKQSNSQPSSGSRQQGLQPPGTQAGSGEPGPQNLNASPPAPPQDDGNRAEIRRLGGWICRELAANNRDMRAAYHIYQQLVETQRPDTWIVLFEILRGHAEIASFGNYIFERNVTFEANDRRQPPQGVPSTVRPPGTPRRQVDRFSELWWNDPLEGTRHGQRRPAAPWPAPRAEVVEVVQPGVHVPRQPLPGVIHGPASSQPVSSDRAWSWSANPETGLPQRDFDLYSDPSNLSNISSLDIGNPLGPVVHSDPGQINVRVPPDWRIDIRGCRSASAIHATGLGGSIPGSDPSFQHEGGHEVRITGPDYEIHQDSASGSGSGSNAQNRTQPPRTLGLVDPQQQQGNDGNDASKGHNSSSFSSSTSKRTGSSSSTQEPLKSESSGGSKGQPSDPNNPITISSASSNPDSPITISSSASNQNSHITVSSSNFMSDQNSHITISSSTASSDHQPTKTTNTPPQPLPTNAPSTTPAPAPASQPLPQPQQTPWYLSWSTSTVIRLREELLRRGIPLTGSGPGSTNLRLKQQMIDRLRRDDVENGVGGEWRPEGEGEGAERAENVGAVEGEDDEGKVDKGKKEGGRGRRRRETVEEQEEIEEEEGEEGGQEKGKGKRRKTTTGKARGRGEAKGKKRKTT